MAINVVSGGYTAAPRMRALCAGVPIPNLLSGSIERPNRYHAATYTLQFALADPGDDGDEVWWSNLGPADSTTNTTAPQANQLRITIQIGLRPRGADEDPGNVTWQSWITGVVDDFDIDCDARVATVSGRDLTALMIDAKTANAYVNQTSSQIAAAIAKAHGLQTNITATTTPVSRYYQDEHSQTTQGNFHRTMTEWDLLTFLAQQETDSNGYPFTVRVDGTTLTFGPGPSPSSNPWVARWEITDNGVSANVNNLRLHRNLNMAKDISVKVISWHSQYGRSVTATSKSYVPPGKGGVNTPQLYVRRLPNLTLDQAQKIADNTRLELSRHERVITFDAPGDLKLTPNVMVKLIGTRTTFDQTYYVDHVQHQYSDTRGLWMSARCKNASPVSEATTPS